MSQAARTETLAESTFKDRRGVPAVPLVRIGHIVSVAGAHAVAVLERSPDAGARDSDPRVQIGAVVQILTPQTAVMGLVTAVTAPMPAVAGKKEDMALAEINLVGETYLNEKTRRLAFRRGVGSLPAIGDGVMLADRHDLTRIYAPPTVASIKVGTLYQDPAVPARLLTDDLLAKHFAIVGSTGSGKSCALTCILQRLLDGHKAAHVVILDVHNEYADAFGDLVEKITLGDFNLPLWMLNFQELCVALTDDDDNQDEEIDILNEAVVYAKKRYADAAAGRAGLLARKNAEMQLLTADTPAPFRVSDVIAFIDDELGKLQRLRKILPYRRLKSRIEALVADQRYTFMFGSLTVQDTMSDVLGRLFRIPNDGKPISVIDLSTVPHEILDVVISVIARLAFDLAVWGRGRLPLLLVCEEAHRYAPAAGDDKFVPTRKALGRIAKEGRKYGISLALVTQRPSELDATILSQCSTAIALRLSSDKDQQVIRQSTYEGMTDVVDFLPLLGDREAIILGQAASMPMRVRFDDLQGRMTPKNLNEGFSNSWKGDTMERAELESIVSRWRATGRERNPAAE
jgi:DNA helicase HerA-like ATPase